MFQSFKAPPATKANQLPPPHTQQNLVFATQQPQQQNLVEAAHPLKIHLPDEEIRRLNVAPSQYSFSTLQTQTLKYLPAINKQAYEPIKKRHLMFYYRDDEGHNVRMDTQAEWVQAISIARSFKENKILNIYVRINESLLEREKQFPESVQEDEEQPVALHQPQPQRTHSFPEPAFAQWNSMQQVQTTQSRPEQFVNTISRATPIFMNEQQLQIIQQHPSQQQQAIFAQPQQMQKPVQIDYNTVLNKLHDMGFKDDNKSVELLRQFNGNTEAVINHYLVHEGHK